MSIVTGKGDDGKTFLRGNIRVNKDHLRVEICGTIDELTSFLGAAKSILKQKRKKEVISLIQDDLFVLAGEIAAPRGKPLRSKSGISGRRVKNIEMMIEKLEGQKVLSRRGFYAPGSGAASSMLDICRAVSRRLERRVVTGVRRKELSGKYIILYLNRLSDLLFLLARREDNR